mgnify:CR=1 FL=1
MKEEKKSYPDRIQAVKLVGAVLLIMIITSLFLGIFLNIFRIEYNLENPFIYMMTIIVSVLSLGGVIWYVIKNKGIDLDYIRGNNVKNVFFYYKTIILMLGLAVVISELDNLLQKIIPMNETYMDLFNGVIDQNMVLVFLSLCIVAPLFEETLFRGIILRGLLDNLEHWSAIFYTAFLFGILHMNIWQGIGAFFTGIILGWLFLKTHSLYVVIFAHFVNNILVIIAVKYTKIPGFSAVSESGFQPVWFTLTGLLLLITGIILIEKRGENSDSRN